MYLVSGLLLTGVLKLPKAHYQLFVIMPLAFLATSAIYRQFPRKRAAYVACTILLVQLAYQVPLYYEWLGRPKNTIIADASREIAARIEQGMATGNIPVIGEYSAQLGLYSERILPLDAKWIDQQALCRRLLYWKPRYHVNVIWQGSKSTQEIERITACPGITGGKRLLRYRIFKEHWYGDYIVLTQLEYTHKNVMLPALLLLL